VDGKNQRVFTSCENMKMEVLNASNGEVVATLPIGAGTDAIGYDPNRGLIYSSNGGGLGSLTIIRQDIEDEYAVIQELPTAGRARTLAVNPISGDVYLVTNIVGFDVNSRPIRKVNGLPVLPATAVIGSFRVMVVGN
jgi:hypothetical protein